MANAPGVRFEESPEQVLVSPASATLAGFVGTSSRGRIDEAVLVSGWADYVEKFGGFADSYDLSIALWDYFRNGGGTARVLRVVGDGAAQSSLTINQVDSAQACLTARAADPGSWGDGLSVDLLRVQQTNDTENAAATAGQHGANHPAANPKSEDVFSSQMLSVRGVQVGDIMTPYTAQGAAIANAEILVLDVNPTHREIRYKKVGGASPVVNGSLKTASRHLVTTTARTEVVHSGTSIEVASADGIERGMLLSIISYCDYEDNLAELNADAATGTSRAAIAEGVVSKVVGNKVHFTSQLSCTGNVNIPASTVAKVRLKGGGDNVGGDTDMEFAAAKLGTAGNDVVIKIVKKAAAGAGTTVSVAGNIITISSRDNTANQIKTAFDAVAAATALASITIHAGGGTEADFPENAATLNLKGGSETKVISQEFDLILKEDGIEVETGRHLGLSLDATSKNFVGNRLGGFLDAVSGAYLPTDSSRSRRLILEVADAVTTSVASMPIGATDLSLSSGSDGASPSDAQIIGVSTPNKTGVHLFNEFDDIDFLAAPGYTSTSLMKDLITYAEGRANLLLLLDAPKDKTEADDLSLFRTQQLGVDTTFAALYAPWGKIADPRPTVPRGSIIEVPPSAAVAGMIARRVDSDGVHFSAANLSPNWVGVITNFDEEAHATLNEDSVNIIRIVRRSGLRLYGSRTLTNKQDGRRFTNVRRFVNFIKQSLAAQIQPLTFQPVNDNLYSQITHLVTQLLTEQWQKGALYPQSSASKAFVVKCDSETTTAVDLANGIVNCVVGISPAVPAEQIVFRLNVSTGGIQVEES